MIVEGANLFVTSHPKNKQLKALCQIKVRSEMFMNTDPYGDKSATARCVVSFIPSHARNSMPESVNDL